MTQINFIKFIFVLSILIFCGEGAYDPPKENALPQYFLKSILIL